MLESYRVLTKEAERLDCTIQQTKDQQSSFELEMTTLQQERDHLQQLCHQYTSEIEQVLPLL